MKETRGRRRLVLWNVNVRLWVSTSGPAVRSLESFAELLSTWTGLFFPGACLTGVEISRQPCSLVIELPNEVRMDARVHFGEEESRLR